MKLKTHYKTIVCITTLYNGVHLKISIFMSIFSYLLTYSPTLAIGNINKDAYKMTRKVKQVKCPLVAEETCNAASALTQKLAIYQLHAIK